jgi:hypothetical protein
MLASTASAPSGDPGRIVASSPVVLGPVALGNQTVKFGVHALDVAAIYDPTVSTTNGTVETGAQANATVRLAGISSYVSVSVPGFAPANVSVTALGTQSVLLPGINYSVDGFPVSVYLELVGAVNGTTFVGANGTGGGVAFSWTRPVNLTIPFAATGPGKSEVDVGVANLSYFLSVGVVAMGVVDGFPVSVNLIAPAPLPAAAGTPSNVAGVFRILSIPAPPPPPFTMPPSLPTGPAVRPFPTNELLLAFLLLGILALGLVLGWTISHRSAGRSPPPGPCPSCGHRVPRGASFCPGCARPLLPGPGSPNPGPPPSP